MVESARLLAAKSFRWDGLHRDHNLIKLPWCSRENCINPFHFARDNRLTKDEVDFNSTPEPPDNTKSPKCPISPVTEVAIAQSPFVLDDMQPCDTCADRWGLCMFWEEKNRIGRTFSISR